MQGTLPLIGKMTLNKTHNNIHLFGSLQYKQKKKNKHIKAMKPVEMHPVCRGFRDPFCSQSSPNNTQTADREGG